MSLGPMGAILAAPVRLTGSALAVHAQGEGHAALVTADAAVVERFLLATLFGLALLHRQAARGGMVGAEKVLHGGRTHRGFFTSSGDMPNVA